MRDVVGRFSRAELCLGLAALLGTFSCTGVIDGGGSPSEPGSGPLAGSTPGAIANNPGRSEMHRLNNTEYNATVKDVLGTALQPANSNWRGGEIQGFDNIASVLGVDETQYNLYLDAAEALANEFFGSPALKARFVSCALTDEAACTKDFITKAGLRIFRRPLRDAEIAVYQKVYTDVRAQGQDHEGSLKHVLWSLLASAEFLFRIELPKGNTARALDGYELASRLSYFLWTSAPDDTLLDAASKNALGKDAEVQATVDRMLADAKSSRFVEAFAGQWLGAREVESHPVAPDRFPDWNAEMATAARDEMYAYFDDFLRNNRSWLEFLQTDVNYVNAALAPLYDMTGVTGTTLQRVQYTTDQRAGFMGLAGFLALSSMDRRTSPTLRGKWVLGNLLCTEAPPPPQDVPKLEVTGQDLENGNIRVMLEQHRTRPDCAGCHAIFDPFGMALENFDAIGRYRTTYGDGSTIDDSTELPASPTYPNGVKFEGIDGAAGVVTAMPEFKSCFAQKLFIYSLGRAPAGDDEAWIEQVAQQWQQGDLTITRLIQTLAQSVPFRNSGDVK
jgi:hypothetical protein